jgi:hypothetical protein
MRYELWQGSKYVGAYETESDALRAAISYCHVDGVPDAESFRALSMDIWRMDELGRRKRRWHGEQIASRLSNLNREENAE